MNHRVGLFVVIGLSFGVMLGGFLINDARIFRGGLGVFIGCVILAVITRRKNPVQYVMIEKVEKESGGTDSQEVRP